MHVCMETSLCLYIYVYLSGSVCMCVSVRYMCLYFLFVQGFVDVCVRVCQPVRVDVLVCFCVLVCE